MQPDTLAAPQPARRDVSTSLRPRTAHALYLTSLVCAALLVVSPSGCDDSPSPIVEEAAQPRTRAHELSVQGARVDLPRGERGHWPPMPTHAPLQVHLSREALYVGGQRVLTLRQGRFASTDLSHAYTLEDRGGTRALYVPELAAALQQAANPLRDALPDLAPDTRERRIEGEATAPRCFGLEAGDWPPIAMVPFIDADIPYETLLHLATTAQVAGVEFEGPVARMPSTPQQQVGWRPREMGLYPLPMRCMPPQYYEVPDAPPMVLYLSQERIVIDVPGSDAAPTVLERDGRPTLWREVYNAVQGRNGERPMGPLALELHAAPDVPLSDLLRAADAVAFHRAPRGTETPRRGMQLDEGRLEDAVVVMTDVRVPRAEAWMPVPAELRRAKVTLRHIDADYASSW